jgi:hypothetical protein
MTTAQGLMGAGYAPGALRAILGEPRLNLMATGTNLATALLIPTSFCVFSIVPAGSGVRLTAYRQSLGHPSVGDTVLIINETTENLNVYPGTVNGQIKQGGAGVPFVLVGRARARFFFIGPDNRWAVLQDSSVPIAPRAAEAEA